jgi:glycerol-3-phosphate dehydrogenase
VLRIIREDASFGERLHPEAPYLRAEAAYAIGVEMARTVEDVLARRTRIALTTPDQGSAAVDDVSAMLAG